jgi:hypothetical protein
MMSKSVHHHQTMGHIIVVTEDRHDRPKLARRGFFQLRMSKNPDNHWYDVAMDLEPGAYMVKHIDGPNGTIEEIEFHVKPLTFHPFDYTIAQWRYITSENDRPPRPRRVSDS